MGFKTLTVFALAQRSIVVLGLDKRAVMSTLGAVKEPPGLVDILQHCLFTLTTEFGHHRGLNALMTRRLLEWGLLLYLTSNGSLILRQEIRKTFIQIILSL